MKLKELYPNMQKRYDEDQNAAKKALEAAEKKRQSERQKRVAELKSIITDLVNTVRSEIENNLEDDIYDKYKEVKKKCTRVKNFKTHLKVDLKENEINVSVWISGYWSSSIKHPMKLQAMKSFETFVVRYFGLGHNVNCELTFLLSENNVIFTWRIGDDEEDFRSLVKEAFPDSVNRSVTKVLFKLD